MHAITVMNGTNIQAANVQPLTTPSVPCTIVLPIARHASTRSRPNLGFIAVSAKFMNIAVVLSAIVIATSVQSPHTEIAVAMLMGMPVVVAVLASRAWGAVRSEITGSRIPRAAI